MRFLALLLLVLIMASSSKANGCCCDRANCNDLRSAFKQLTGVSEDPHKRGSAPYKVGWHRTGVTEEWRRAFAAALNVPVTKLNEESNNEAGQIHVNRLHYDPRQIELFDSNSRARSTLLRASDMMKYTNVREERAHVMKKGVMHLHHLPNYPWASAQADLATLSSTRQASRQNFSRKREAAMIEGEQLQQE